MTRLMANGGALLNSVMCRVSKEPDIIFLQVGGNDFPRTAWNQRDADAFSLQLLELASLLNDRYKAKRVVVGCSLPLPAVSCTQQALTVTVAIYSGYLYEYVWSLDITKWWAYFTLTFLCCCLLRGLSHVLLLHYRQFCPLWAVDGCPPSDEIFTFRSSITGILPPAGR